MRRTRSTDFTTTPKRPWKILVTTFNLGPRLFLPGSRGRQRSPNCSFGCDQKIAAEDTAESTQLILLCLNNATQHFEHVFKMTDFIITVLRRSFELCNFVCYLSIPLWKLVWFSFMSLTSSLIFLWFSSISGITFSTLVSGPGFSPTSPERSSNIILEQHETQSKHTLGHGKTDRCQSSLLYIQ